MRDSILEASIYLDIQPTSLVAFRRIREEGLLTDARLEVYRAVARAPEPMTANELRARAESFTGNTVRLDSFHKRLSELRERGVIEIVGERTCRVSGFLANLWASTGELPREPEKKESYSALPRKAELAEAVKILEYWRKKALLGGEKIPDSVDATLRFLRRKSG